jgi:hypothetical protein
LNGPIRGRATSRKQRTNGQCTYDQKLDNSLSSVHMTLLSDDRKTRSFEQVSAGRYGYVGFKNNELLVIIAKKTRAASFSLFPWSL